MWWESTAGILFSLFLFPNVLHSFAGMHFFRNTTKHLLFILLVTAVWPASNLTFQKWFVSFPNENNSKADLNVAYHSLETKKIFHSRLSELALNNFLPFYRHFYLLCLKCWNFKKVQNQIFCIIFFPKIFRNWKLLKTCVLVMPWPLHIF